MIIQVLIDDIFISLKGEWRNNLTLIEEKLLYFETYFLPYKQIFVMVFSSLGLIVTPFAGYIAYSTTPKNLTEYKYYAIYNRITLTIFALINLLWQPVCISPMFIIYSQGIMKNFSSTIQFIMLWLFLSSGLCSVHAIGSAMLYLCKISLLPCNSWHGNPTKYRILMTLFASLVFCSIFIFWLTFPDSNTSLSDYFKEYQFLKNLLSSKNALLAFNILNLPVFFKVFIIYLLVVIIICAIIFPLQVFDFYVTLWKQKKFLSKKTQIGVISLSISIKIRTIFLMSFIHAPFISCCIFLYFGFFPIYFSFCLCLFSMFPFFDAFVEIFVIKFNRQKALYILSFGRMKYRNKIGNLGGNQ